MSTPDYDSLIDCAAIQLPDGEVWTGKRHNHCIATIIQAKGEPQHNATQGFVTMSGRFVTREEAYELVLKTKQVAPKFERQLFSEDLY